MAGTSSTATIPETTLTLVRGDSDDILVTVEIPDANDPTILNRVRLDQAVDGTADRPAILRAAIKEDYEDLNENALVFSESHYPDQINFLDQTVAATEGQARWLIDKPDTESGDPETSYCWDLEVTQQDFLRTGAQVGSIETQASPNGATILGSGTAFTKAKVGDVLQILDGTNDAFPALIEEITSDTVMVVSFADWPGVASGKAFEIRRGKHTTAARGPFVLERGQVGGP